MPSRQVEQTFGILIAYVFPGLIGLYAVGLYLPVVQSWFESPMVTDLILMIIVASGVGVFLSVVRWAIYEKMLGKWFCETDDHKQQHHDDNSEQSLQGIIMQLYRYYQFCANTSVAVVVCYVAWLASGGARAGIAGVVVLVLVGVLFWSAHDSWDRDQRARRELYVRETEGV